MVNWSGLPRPIFPRFGPIDDVAENAPFALTTIELAESRICASGWICITTAICRIHSSTKKEVSTRLRRVKIPWTRSIVTSVEMHQMSEDGGVHEALLNISPCFQLCDRLGSSGFALLTYARDWPRSEERVRQLSRIHSSVSGGLGVSGATESLSY